MTDNNILLTDTYYYNKYYKSNDKNNSKLQIVSSDKMFSNIIDFKNMNSVIDYDDNITSNVPKSLNDYYQKYPILDLTNKTILNDIYNITNVEDLIKWLNNNKNKHFNTLNRVLDISWLEFNKKMFYNIEEIKEIYFNLYIKRYNNISFDDIKIKVNNTIKNYNYKKDIYFSYILNSEF